MAKKQETVFIDGHVKPFLKKLSNTWFVKTQQKSRVGTPDFLVCINGHFIALEAKKDGKSKVDPMQIWELEKILAASGLSFVPEPGNWPYIKGVLEYIARTGKKPVAINKDF